MRDSNPRNSYPFTAFRVRPDRPLRQLSFEPISSSGRIESLNDTEEIGCKCTERFAKDKKKEVFTLHTPIPHYVRFSRFAFFILHHASKYSFIFNRPFLSHGIVRVNSTSAHLAFKKGSFSIVLFSPQHNPNNFGFCFRLNEKVRFIRASVAAVNRQRHSISTCLRPRPPC